MVYIWELKIGLFVWLGLTNSCVCVWKYRHTCLCTQSLWHTTSPLCMYGIAWIPCKSHQFPQRVKNDYL